MTARRVVVLLVVALAAYFAIIGYRGVYLLQQHAVALRALGIAVLVLPVVGGWVVVAEIRFGLATQRLAERLDDEGAPPEERPARLPSGRIDRTSADELFSRRRSEVEADPGDWRGWYRLAIAYDQAGDRRRARAAMRTAVEKAAAH